MSSDKRLLSRVLLVVAAILLAPALWLTFTHAEYNQTANLLSLAAALVLIVACVLQWRTRTKSH